MALVFFFLALVVVLSQFPWGRYANELDVPLLALLGLFCIAPAIVGIIRKKFYIFEPVHTYSFSTLVYFVIVPLALIYNGDFYFAGINYRPELPRVIVLTSDRKSVV